MSGEFTYRLETQNTGKVNFFNSTGPLTNRFPMNVSKVSGNCRVFYKRKRKKKKIKEKNILLMR